MSAVNDASMSENIKIILLKCIIAFSKFDEIQGATKFWNDLEAKSDEEFRS